MTLILAASGDSPSINPGLRGDFVDHETLALAEREYFEKLFDSIPHDELLQCVARRVSDKAVLHLIKMWLIAPVEERKSGGKHDLLSLRRPI